MTAAALAAMFVATACGQTGGGGGRQSEGSTTSSTPTTAHTTTSLMPGANCQTNPDGSQVCAIPGRPLWRRRRRPWRRRGVELLLPPGGPQAGDEDARTEYASVASFGELALRLIAVGAPVELVERCHRAALDEIGHARTTDALARRGRDGFGAIPALWGRRIGGRARIRSRAAQLETIAVESFVDGWLNEGAAAADLWGRAAAADDPAERAALQAMAEDEQRHAELGRDIVTWCFEQDPEGVGAALARLRLGVEPAAA